MFIKLYILQLLMIMIQFTLCITAYVHHYICVSVITEACYQLTGAGWATGGIHLIAAHCQCHTLFVLNQNLQRNNEKMYCCLIFRSGYFSHSKFSYCVLVLVLLVLP